MKQINCYPIYRNRVQSSKKQYVLLLLFLFCSASSLFSQEKSRLITYEVPSGVPMNGDFTIRVKQGNQDWQSVPSYLVQVAKMTEKGKESADASMACFDFKGEVEVAVTYNKGSVESARVRPLSYGIKPELNGNTILFKLDRPRNLSVEVNGDIFGNLHLFANPVDEYVPDRNDPDLIYFGPGVHRLEDERLRIPSGKTVYVAGGAYIIGQLNVRNAKNVKIMGRGIIDPRVRAGVSISNSKDVVVEGLILSQCPVGGSEQIIVRNVKSINQLQWGDGLNVFASNDVLFDGVFCRNSDDCTTVYGTRMGFKGGCKNITMQNATLWADIAHPIFIGIHGDTENPEILENLNYINIDILDQKERQIDYQGCLAINAGDNNLIRNVRFEDIRIEDIRQGQLVNLRIFYNEKYCTAPGRGIEDILFKNVSYEGNNAEISIFSGYNEERKVKNIRFENLVINGRKIYDKMPGKPGYYKTSDMCNFYLGEHVENVTFSE